MTKKFSEITLQNAVVNASYAASIESELPSADVVAAMGGGTEGWMNAIGQYMMMLQGYMSASDNIHIDGAKDRKSVVLGKSVSVRVALDGGRIIKKKK